MDKFFHSIFGKEMITALAIVYSLSITISSFFMLTHSSSIFLMIGFVIFYFMMSEDFYEHTIDMGLVFLLLLCFIFSYNDFKQGINFILIYIGSLAFIQSLLALTAYEAPICSKDNAVKDCDIKEKHTEKDTQYYGWLPSFGMSLFIFLLLSVIFKNQYIPYLTEAGYGFDMFVDFIFPKDLWHIIALVLILLLIWFYLNQQNRKKERENKKLIYAFGDGDGYVFAAFIALFGIKYFFLILFLNMIFLLLLGLPQYLKQRKSMKIAS